MSEDINKLFNYIESEIQEIKDKDEDVSEIKVKSILENLRSSLDYLAHDIAALIPSKDRKSKFYFPYSDRKKQFNRNFIQNFPTLKESHPKLFDIIEAVQPHISKEQWLFDLCTLVNKVKHENLSQIEKKSVPKRIVIPGLVDIPVTDQFNFNFSENVVNNVRQDDIEMKDGDVKITSHSGTALVINGSKIQFCGKSIEAIPFLDQCLSKLKNLVLEVETYIDSI